MRTMLAEYEKTLAQFIDARRNRPDQHSSIDQLIQDKKKLELEIQTLQISYQNLHQRYEDLKGLQEQSRINDATLRQSIQLLQQELASTVRTLENTRRAYEDKIEKYVKSKRKLVSFNLFRLNIDTKNTRETLEYELSATKAKLLKSELKTSSLESAIEAKTKENSELMTICDELIHKMDKRCT
jgi:chromosome segregation ATPase